MIDEPTMTWTDVLQKFCPREIGFGGGMATIDGDLIGETEPTRSIIPFRVYQLASRMFAPRYRIRWICRREIPAARERRRELL